MRECRQCGMPLHNTATCPCAKNWELGQYVRVWKNEGYEYGHIESIEFEEEGGLCWFFGAYPAPESAEVMLVGDDGKEIYCRVKDLEEE